MRTGIRHASHAKLYGKVAKQLLLENFSAPEGTRFPSLLTRDAICRGFGYRSYGQIEHLLRNPNRALPPTPSDEELLAAFKQGFTLAIPIVNERGFTTEQSQDALVDELASEAVRRIQARYAESNQVNFGNASLPGESLPSVDLAERILALKRRFRSPVRQ